MLVAIVSLCLLTVSCTSPDEAGEGDGLTILATTSVIGDIVANVVGDEADVEVLIPIGADSHEYQFSAAQVAAMQQADVIFANGLGLEESLADVLESLEGDGANVLEIAPLVDPIPFGESEHEDEDSEHEDGDLDPHVWMDPLRMVQAARLIATELATLDPSVDWMSNAEAYVSELVSLDADIISLLAVVPNDSRKLVTNHDAFGYFADRYEFEVVGTIIPSGSTLADPSSAELAELVMVMEAENITAIFAETSSSDALASAVAAELGTDVAIVELFTESLSEEGTDADTYIGMLRENGMRIANSLS